MSVTRNLFNEIRPFFRLFDEVSRTHPAYSVVSHPFGRQFDPFLQPRHPSVDISEQGNEYIVEAEVPGVKKENLSIRIGDGGRNITIEGQLFARSPSESESSNNASANELNGDTADTPGENNISKHVSDPCTHLFVEREFAGSAHFTRTVWLPQPVNGSRVAGKLADGILTIRVPKAEEKDSIKVEIQ